MNETPTHFTALSDPHYQPAKSLLCWQSVFTGVFVALLTYFIFTALGAGIGGFRIAHLIDRNENGSGLFTGAAIWLGVSSVVSLFLGSYYATRISTTPNRKIGGAHGILIAALFFAFLMYGAGNMLGSLANMMNSALLVVSDADAEKAARDFGDMGWIIFVMLSLGTSAAVLGGYEGSTANTRKPMHLSLRPPNKNL